MQVLTIETESLGDRSYLIHDGTHALVVDPQRDLERVFAALDEHDLTCAGVFETHVHNDYVSGGRALAERTGAPYHLAAAETDLAFEHVGLADGDEVKVGSLVVQAIHTPGHTPHHLSYAVRAEGEEASVVCTGGGLLFGSVGRTDLLGPDQTEELTAAQYRSAHRLADTLADDVAVLPTHGFGSFCSSGDTTEASESTIGRERETNDALTAESEEAFVAELLAGLDAHPAYYAHMGPRNRAGAAAADLAPPEPVDVATLRRRIEDGEWVVDLRERQVYAAGHLAGTINVEVGTTFATYLGWIIPWGTPVTLVGASTDDVAEAQVQLARIGIDRPAGRADADLLDGADTVTYPTTDFAGVAELLADEPDLTLLDLRRDLEWEDGHVADAVHVPLHELLDRLDDLPDGRLAVHCASGFRASIGASLLHRDGRDVVLVDDPFEHAAEHLDVVTAD